AGRFAGLDAKPGELVRAVVDRDRDQRVAILGPAKLIARDDASLELVAGTLLVDARDPVRALHVRIGDVDVRAQNVRFGVETGDRERRTPVTIRDGAVSHIAVEPPQTPPPPPTPPPSVTQPVPPVVAPHSIAATAAELYARAEAALAASDRAYAESLWREL